MTAEFEPPPSVPYPPRGALRLLVDPVFGPFFAVRLLSAIGIWIHNIVAAILVFELSGSALMVGMVSVAQFGPQLILAALSGAMADRGDRRLQLVAGKLLVTAASAGLAAWISLAGVDGLSGAWTVVAASFVVGLGLVLVAPAQNALIPALVRPQELAPAIALNSVPPTVSRAAGPAVGAVVAATVGPAAAFTLTAITNVAFALVVLRLNVRTRADNRAGSDRRIRVGLQHLRKDHRILPLLIGVAAIGVGADPVITLTPSLSAGFGAGPTLVGLFASAFGVGACMAVIALAGLQRRMGLQRLGPGGLLMLALGIAATGLSQSPAMVVVSLVVAGGGMALALTSLTTQLQERVPDDIRGRIMALWSIAFLGSRPIAAAANGAVADATAPAVAFLMVAIVVAAAAWRCRPVAIPKP